MIGGGPVRVGANRPGAGGGCRSRSAWPARRGRPVLTMMFAELVRLGEPAAGVERELERPGPAAQGLPDPAGGGLDVLLADRGGHVHRRHFAGGQLLRVEPQPHGVVPLAEHGDVRHALDAQELVADVDRGEVAQVDVVVPAVRGVEVDDQQHVRGALADRDALLLDRRRQDRHGELTRFWTMTRAAFRSVPISNVTVSE